MYIDSKEKSGEIVKKLYEYMRNEGFDFRSVVLTDGSPYAILKNNTSLSFRKSSRKFVGNGIVLFCAADGVDKNKLVNKLGLTVEDNSTDQIRPYAVFIPDAMFEKAVDALK